MRKASNSQAEMSRRADEIRQRRSAKSRNRINSVASRVANPVNPRPVIARGGTVGKGWGTPIHRQAGTHARRQFYITMDSASGTELRLPAISLVNPGWRALSLLLVIVTVVCIYSMMNSPFFRINTLDVRGVQRVSADDLSAALDLENLPIIEVNQKEIQAKIGQEFPELINVMVTVELPNNVTISAGERQPVLAWKKGDTISWVDGEGVIFPARGELTNANGEPTKLLTINSEDALPSAPLARPAVLPASGTAAATETEQPAASSAKKDSKAAVRIVDPTLIKAAQLLAQKLPGSAEGQEMPDLIYDNLNGLGWNDPQGWQVFIGRDLSEFDAKYAMYQKIASALSENGLHPTLISVEQLSAPFYRLEQ